MKLAFADAYRYVGDPRTMECTPAGLLDPDYLAARAARSIRTARRTSGPAIRREAAPSIFAPPTSAG